MNFQAGEITASADRYDKVIVGNYQVYATMYNIGDEVIDLCPDGIQMLVFALFRIWCKLQYISQPALPALLHVVNSMSIQIQTF